MASSLDPLTVQRLAYVRFLYEEAAEYARRPHPLSCTAVLMLHDAVENFLGLAADHHGTNPDPKIQFMQYWSELKTKAQIDLPGRGAMTGLNTTRVALKHHGTFPSDQTIQGAVKDALRFFSTASPVAFGVDFDSIDMVDLVTQPDVARLLREAQTHADIGDHVHALAGVSLAFDALLDHYSGRFTRPRTQVFRFGPTLEVFDEPRIEGARAPKRLRKLTEIANETQHALRAMALGIDYAGLARLKILVPQVDGFADGRRSYVESAWCLARTVEDYNWARHFVIESALRAARADDIQGLLRDQHAANWNPAVPFSRRMWTGAVKHEDPEEASVFEADL
ncbi:hypothetical protein AB0F46_18620 [Streptomyces sp. NPDC026665]|uniref:hypothetical protein n=1 Tax=Streptomyces sp. NPDC026665 TaxID=3154798 RepID=UPI003402B259